MAGIDQQIEYMYPEDSRNPSRIRLLINEVNKHSVLLDQKTPYSERGPLMLWLLDTLGKERNRHPMMEAEEGWMDVHDGVWALDRVDLAIWFQHQSDLTAFMLAWQGEVKLKRPHVT